MNRLEIYPVMNGKIIIIWNITNLIVRDTKNSNVANYPWLQLHRLCMRKVNCVCACYSG